MVEKGLLSCSRVFMQQIERVEKCRERVRVFGEIERKTERGENVLLLVGKQLF